MQQFITDVHQKVEGGCLGSGITVYGFFSISPLTFQISFGNQEKELRGLLSEADEARHLQLAAQRHHVWATRSTSYPTYPGWTGEKKLQQIASWLRNRVYNNSVCMLEKLEDSVWGVRASTGRRKMRKEAPVCKFEPSIGVG